MSHRRALKAAVTRAEELVAALAPIPDNPEQRRILLAIVVTEAITTYQEARMLREEARS